MDKKYYFYGIISSLLSTIITFILLIILFFNVRFNISMISYRILFFFAPIAGIMFISLNCYFQTENKINNIVSILFSSLFVLLIMSIIFIQLTINRINPINLNKELLELIALNPGTPIYSLYILAFGFLSLSSLFLSFSLQPDIFKRKLKITTFIFGQFFVPAMILPGSPFIKKMRVFNLDIYPSFYFIFFVICWIFIISLFSYQMFTKLIKSSELNN